MSNQQTHPIGGIKKILYVMQTIKGIGVRNSQKALTSKNTCKACGLGMGGQRGGMTNESGEFPAVCNKSIQAQSTDIQPAIPDVIFDRPLKDFQALSSYEIEHLGRLGKPVFKAKESHRFQIVDWPWAIDYAARKFAQTPAERSFFYASGRSSNEAGFILQLMARLYGTNNINNCSYYCHQATGVGMSSTLGTATATVELADLEGCDLIFVIGANPASNHPRLLHKLAACRARGGKVIVINPAKEPGLVRFSIPKSPASLIKGGNEIASHYLQPNIGSDIVLLNGIAKWIIENNAQDDPFIAKHTEDYPTYLEQIQSLSWKTITQLTGLNQHSIAEVAKIYAESKATIFTWGMGITQHSNGTGNVEALASLALLRGMVGQPHKGLLPLRGHSNVQGIGSIGVKPVLVDTVIQRMEEHLGVDLPRTDQSAGLDTLACVKLAHEGAIDAALLMGGNLYQASPQSAWAKQALDRIDFKLSLTTTLNKGHVHCCDHSEMLILPITARDEEHQSTTQESMFSYVRLSEGGIQRIPQARSEVDVITDLASALFTQQKITATGENTIDFQQFKSHQIIRELIAKSIPDLDAFKDIGSTKKEFHIPHRLLHTREFTTPSGQCRFITHLPTMKKNPDYPMQLMSVRSEGQFNSIVYEENDSYREIDQRWAIMISHADLKALNLVAGDKVTVQSEHGKMTAVTVYPFDLPEGNVMAYYPEANILIGTTHDPRSKTPAFKSVSVRIEK